MPFLSLPVFAWPRWLVGSTSSIGFPMPKTQRCQAQYFVTIKSVSVRPWLIATVYGSWHPTLGTGEGCVNLGKTSTSPSDPGVMGTNACYSSPQSTCRGLYSPLASNTKQLWHSNIHISSTAKLFYVFFSEDLGPCLENKILLYEVIWRFISSNTSIECHRSKLLSWLSEFLLFFGFFCAQRLSNF